MYLNIHGCDKYPTLYTTGNQSEYVTIHGAVMYLPICYDPRPQPIIANMVFISYVVLSNFILLSLTVASVTTGIKNRLAQLKHDMAREDAANLALQGGKEERSGRVSNQNKGRYGLGLGLGLKVFASRRRRSNPGSTVLPQPNSSVRRTGDLARKLSTIGTYVPPTDQGSEYLSLETKQFIENLHLQDTSTFSPPGYPSASSPSSKQSAGLKEKILLRSLLMRVWRDVKDASGGGILKSEDSIGTTSNGYHLLYTTFALQRMLAAWPYKTAVFLLLLAAASLDVFVIQEGYLEPIWVVGASICLQGLLTLDLALHAVSRYPLVSEYLANKWVLLDWCLMVAIWLVTGYYWEYSIVLELVSMSLQDQCAVYMKVDSDASGQIDFAEFCELIHMMGTAYNPGEMKHMGHGAAGGPAGGLASSAQPPHVSALLSPNKQFSPTSSGKSAQERWARAIGGVSDRVLVKDTDDDMQLETVKDHEEEKK
eukprot:gene200-202_t